MKFKVSFNVNKTELKSINLRPFYVGLIAGGVMAIMSYFGFNPSKLISPLPTTINVMDIVLPKLQERVNDYQLKEKTASFIPEVHASASYDEASAYAVVDFDSGNVIAEKDISKRLPIASLTKIMTAVVAMDLSSPDEIITISKKASLAVPTKIGLQPGQKLTLSDLLHAALLTSANDAAYAIKDGIDHKYGDPVFIDAMNAKAQFIGLKNTHFTNPQGFDNPEHYSTVEDLAILSHYALTHYPYIAEIVKKDYQFIESSPTHPQFDLYNWNGLIGVYPNTFGMKIGNTDKAGMTTVVASERDSKRLLAVVLGAPGVLERDLWASELLDYGFEQTYGLKPVSVTEEQLQAKYATWKYWQ